MAAVRVADGTGVLRGSNDDGTNYVALALLRQRSGVLMLSNSWNPHVLLDALLGRTCAPWFWKGYIPYDRPALIADGAAAPVVTPGCGG